MNELVAVIMAGGKGERFWPKSRANHPKQLLPIVSPGTMLQETVERIEYLIPEKNIFIATGESLSGKVKAQLPSLPEENIILEPVGKNTAACIGLAAIKVERKYPGSTTMVVLAADHLIGEREKFLEIIKTGAEVAEKTGHLVTLGIKPTRAETGYGYIEVKGRKLNVENKNEIEVYKVERFVEKPGKAEAKRFLSRGNYYWNSGMFIWKVESILKSIEEHMPELFKGLETIKDSLGTPREAEVTRQVFQKLKSISIDYGVMERAKSVFMVESNITWDDVGSWLAMERIHPKDDNGNVVIGKFEGIDSHNCIIINDGHLVTTLGVSDLIIVTTPQATLICAKDRAQDVKKIVKKLADKKQEEYL
ncbi:MAG: mannose-1-phosphate guanylyltransferase [Nitrospirae bacterium]|nr:mannose-1-phosphate guanylyltransferase [Nitrospirota bacterium]